MKNIIKEYIKNLLSVCFLICLSTAGYTQQGSYPISVFGKKELHYPVDRLWCMDRASNGLVYIGVGGGVLEFDGKNSTKISVPGAAVRSILALGDTIYVGSNQEFGYILKDSKGKSQYYSMLKAYNDTLAHVGTVWSIHQLKDKVFFRTQKNLIIYHLKDKKFSSIQTTKEGDYARSWSFGDNFFITDWEKGLLRYQGDSLTMMLPYEKMPIDDLPDGIFPLDTPGEFLMYFYNHGVVKYKEGVFTKISKSAELLEWCTKYGYYAGTILKDGRLAWGSNIGGVLLYNPKNEEIEYISSKDGIEKAVNEIIQDDEGVLWISHSKTITRVDLDSKYRMYGVGKGMDERLYDLHVTDNTIYVAGNKMPLVASLTDTSKVDFKKYSEYQTQTWFVGPDLDGKKLYFGGMFGIFVADPSTGKILEKASTPNTTFKIIHLKKHPELLLAATYGGVYVFKKTPSGLQRLGMIGETFIDFRYIAEDDYGNIWVSSTYEGLWMLPSEVSLASEEEVKKATFIQKSPCEDISKKHRILETPNGLVFITECGYFTNKNQDLTPTNLPIPKEKQGLTSLYLDQSNRWIDFVGLDAYSFQGDQIIVDSLSLKFLHSPSVHLEQDSEGRYWVNNENGLYYFREDVFSSQREIPSKLQWKSIVLLENDSLIPISASETILEYAFNSIGFYVSDPDFVFGEDKQYSFKLSPKDSHWSHWTEEPFKEFTNLREGTYELQVRVKNYRGNISAPISYAFTVRPPWQRTYFAYAMYAIGALLVLYFSVKGYSRKLIKDKEELERIILDRTSEIRKQNDEILAYSAELSQQKEEIQAQADALTDANAVLENQKSEILNQSESLKQAHEEILSINEDLQNKNDEISEQRDRIQKINNNLLASISYAKRIQVAIMPYEAQMASTFAEYFVFYRPKDIVSGDFYWMKEVGDTLLLAVVDCTGHGVPGAFMSMIGSVLLNDIIGVRGITSPKEILQSLDDGARFALKKEHSDNRDGMDISLISFNKKSKVLTMGGAHHTIYYYKDGELHQRKGDKRSIAEVRQEDIPFTETSLILETPLQIYLTSDGFQDQFGGELDRKFSSRRLRELITSNVLLPMDQQKENFVHTLDAWKGERKQTDDILLLGIKLNP